MIFHCVYIPHLFHSTVDGHLGYFYNLDIVNRAVVNIRVHRSFFFLRVSIEAGLPWWISGKASTCQCRRWGFHSWLERSPGEGNGNPLQYSGLGNPIDRGAWWAAVMGSQRVALDLATKATTSVRMHCGPPGPAGSFRRLLLPSTPQRGLQPLPLSCTYLGWPCR